MRYKHRHASSILALEKYLLCFVVLAVKLNLRAMVEIRFSALHIVAIDGAWRCVVGYSIVDLLILALAIETTHRADNRQLNLANKVALAVILENLVLRVNQVLCK